MGFRDEATALRARVEALEAEVARLEEENERLRCMADPQTMAPRFVALLDRLRERLDARGERVRSRDVYSLARAGYDGFYASREGREVFVAVHPRALREGLRPFLVQLRGGDLAARRAQLGPRWRVNDKSLIGWGDGHFVDLDPPDALEGDARVDWLIDEIEAIRAAAG